MTTAPLLDPALVRLLGRDARHRVFAAVVPAGGAHDLDAVVSATRLSPARASYAVGVLLDAGALSEVDGRLVAGELVPSSLRGPLAGLEAAAIVALRSPDSAAVVRALSVRDELTALAVADALGWTADHARRRVAQLVRVGLVVERRATGSSAPVSFRPHRGARPPDGGCRAGGLRGGGDPTPFIAAEPGWLAAQRHLSGGHR